MYNPSRPCGGGPTRPLKGTVLRDGDTPARLDGDEFAVLLEDVDTAAAEEIADRLLQTLRAPSPDEPPLDASIGLAVAGDGWNAEDLMRAADAAMCAAKAGGKGQLRLYDEILAASSGREALLEDLEHALTRRELRVQYQPLVDLRTRRVTAVEALLRWHHPVRGRIAPLDFVPLAEESGLIVAIGGWVLETAVQQVLDWEADRPDDAPLSVSVNVSAAQLADPGAVDALADVIARTGIDPERLTLEVPESVLIADLETTAFQMRRLAALGVPLSIDTSARATPGWATCATCRSTSSRSTSPSSTGSGQHPSARRSCRPS